MAENFDPVLLLVSLGVSINAQVKSNKIRLGNKTLIVQGVKFNEIEYDFSDSKSKFSAFQFIDKKKKVLTISEVAYEFENGKYQAVKVEMFTCPLDKIDKQNSYYIEMENETVSVGKYWRLTLVSKGSGADNLYFQKQTITPENIDNTLVNNLTVNISNQMEAEKWLIFFTK